MEPRTSEASGNVGLIQQTHEERAAAKPLTSWIEQWINKATFQYFTSSKWEAHREGGLLHTLFPEEPMPFQDSAEHYDSEWMATYDMVLVIVMVCLLWILLTFTVFWHPDLFTDIGTYWLYWASLLFRIFIMMASAYAGGLMVLHMGLKMNYTRKIQHFAAYFVPLIMDELLEFPYADGNDYVLGECWGYYAVMVAFAALIYPIRTRLRCIDVQFFSLDRPEDRPHTLQWMTTQVLIGDSILVFFKWYFLFVLESELAQNLVFIPTIIVGIGDGLAEPVGITWGKHKYRTRSLSCDGKKYTRSYEGSFTVYITGLLCCLAFYPVFENWHQWLVACVAIPPAMTLAEAISPHTWDTPLMMVIGCMMVVGVSYIP